MTRAKILAAALFAVSTLPLVRSLAKSERQRQTGAAGPEEFVNSLGIEMVRVPAGSYHMGDPVPLQQITSNHFKLPDDADERPAHEVTISHPFYISEAEITAAQYHKFRGNGNSNLFPPYITGISWYDATEFAVWLTKKEGRPYRLPTEAEWEYACRAGTTSPFYSGHAPPAQGQANAWNLKDMESGPAEWVLNWYGPYPDSAQVDPVGLASGFARVVRGGLIEALAVKPQFNSLARFYRRCANRASIAPVYCGVTAIGFRIVEAPPPKTKPLPGHVPFFRQFVMPTGSAPIRAGPNPQNPWFEQRDLLPLPPEDATPQEILAAGFDPAIHGHNHSPGLAVCSNGDILMIFFSSVPTESESSLDTSFVGTRLRFGSNQWDPPGVFFDFADANNQSVLLWNDHGRINFFGGGRWLDDVPFRWTWSDDNGARWNPIHFPELIGPIGSYVSQPITSAFRVDGTMYVATDARGAHSLLWGSRDNGRTWFDTGGRTGGRHTAFVTLKDGTILGMGGKNSNIDGYMPESISRDGGKTWNLVKSPFPALGTNQRPTIIRLTDGKLFFASDFQDLTGKAPPGITERGAFVALSSDDGKTWKIKRLDTALPHESHVLSKIPRWKGRVRDHGRDATLGYTVAAQAPNGIIHLITTMNHPAQEMEMNEAWILSPDKGPTPTPVGPGKTVRGEKKFSDGKPEAVWSGKVEQDGRYELDGTEQWYYPSGQPEYEVNYRGGNKVGLETYWTQNGRIIWQWDHRPGGTSVWTHYWPNGRKHQQSHWRGEVCDGPATLWAPSGKVIGRYEFHGGMIVSWRSQNTRLSARPLHMLPPSYRQAHNAGVFSYSFGPFARLAVVQQSRAKLSAEPLVRF
jgi:formylglycine-generating enzyme required for sulfatase activity